MTLYQYRSFTPVTGAMKRKDVLIYYSLNILLLVALFEKEQLDWLNLAEGWRMVEIDFFGYACNVTHRAR